MQKRLIQYIRKHQLFKKDDKLVVAVSGGADSMVLLQLLHSTGFNITAAHCNFNLRPYDCDEDQLLVEEFCHLHHIPCYTKSFDTISYAQKNKLSTEMAARELRYNWFEELRQNLNADYIVTAHHANDNIETVLLHMVRGTGLKGLTGIQPKNHKIVRPLLWADRSAIESFARINNIPFRIDNTNLNNTIPRNRIRINVIPELESLNPSFIRTMRQNIAVWNDWLMFAQHQLDCIAQTVVTKNEDTISFDFKKLPTPDTQRLILFQTLQNLGIEGMLAAEMLKILNSQPGTRLKTKTHHIIHNRDSILIKPSVKESFNEHVVELIPHYLNEPFLLKIDIEPYTGQKISPSSTIASIDIRKITPPLILRPWKPGDRFIPFGMKNSKKLSDFLTDLKLSPDEKSNQWVLCDQRQIVWVVGRRIDNRYRIDAHTEKIAVLELL